MTGDVAIPAGMESCYERNSLFTCSQASVASTCIVMLRSLIFGGTRRRLMTA